MASPILLIRPLTSVSPDWYLFGVRPKCAPTVLDELNRPGSSTAALKLNATTAPTPALSSAGGTPHRRARPREPADAADRLPRATPRAPATSARSLSPARRVRQSAPEYGRRTGLG